jgi:hypothetical protein
MLDQKLKKLGQNPIDDLKPEGGDVDCVEQDSR